MFNCAFENNKLQNKYNFQKKKHFYHNIIPRDTNKRFLNEKFIRTILKMHWNGVSCVVYIVKD